MNLAKLIVLLLAVYVTCAPQSNVDRYEVEQNGMVVTTPQAPDPTGIYGTKYNVTNLADGTYTIRGLPRRRTLKSDRCRKHLKKC